MRVAVASGKGGTGKTTVATNLAVVAALDGTKVHLVDCDVEEPNCHVFVDPELRTKEDVTVPVPVVDNLRCQGCGECARICEFNALACYGEGVMTFLELCHGCGGCWLVCPEGAIRPGARSIGVVEEGVACGFRFTQGRLRVGEALSPPLIHRTKRVENESELVIVDSPPGTSCPAIAAMKDVDYVILVTEPTPFGLNDLELAVNAVRRLGIPFGVVINRSDIGDDRVCRYCSEQRIPILLEIPDDIRIARAYSDGQLAVATVPDARGWFDQLYTSVFRGGRGGVVCGSS